MADSGPLRKKLSKIQIRMPIGPSLPPHLAHLSNQEEEDEFGPSIGPQIPSSSNSSHKPSKASDIGPQIPIHLLQSRNSEDDDEQEKKPIHRKKVYGPTIPTVGPVAPSSSHADEVQEDDDLFGPVPLPASLSKEKEEHDKLAKRLEIESRFKKSISSDSNQSSSSGPKTRDEWMMVPPKAKGDVSSLLWTETPQEKAKRLSDAAKGIKHRETDESADVPSADSLAERAKKEHDAASKAIVEEYNKSKRPISLMEQHDRSNAVKNSSTSRPDQEYDIAAGLSRDVLFQPVTKKSRTDLVKDAQSLSSRFASSKKTYL